MWWVRISTIRQFRVNANACTCNILNRGSIVGMLVQMVTLISFPFPDLAAELDLLSTSTASHIPTEELTDSDRSREVRLLIDCKSKWQFCKCQWLSLNRIIHQRLFLSSRTLVHSRFYRFFVSVSYLIIKNFCPLTVLFSCQIFMCFWLNIFSMCILNPMETGGFLSSTSRLLPLLMSTLYPHGRAPLCRVRMSSRPTF